MLSRTLFTTVFVLATLPSGLFPCLESQSRSGMGSVSLTGRVLEENGQPPNKLVQVDLICNGRIRQQTLTSSDGTFIFDLDPAYDESWLDPASGGSATGAFEGSAKVASSGRSVALDEVPPTGTAMVTLTGCEVRLSPIPGISSNAIALRTRGSFDTPDIGVIVIKRLSNNKATTVSISTLIAPEKARNAFEKANDALVGPDPDLKKALKELKKAVKHYPAYSAAWDLMGRVQLSQGNRKEGRDCFLRAIKEEPGFIPPYAGVAQMAFQDSDWEETSAWSLKVLELDERYPQALYWHGLAAFYLRNFEDSEKSLSSLYTTEGHYKSYPFGLLPLGVVHANMGNLEAAAEEFGLYLELMPETRVPEMQRKELEEQIAAWKSQGLISSSPSGPGPTESP